MTQLANYSQTIGTTAVLIWPQFGVPVSYMRIWNVSPTGGPTIWLSRSTSSPVANTAGSYPLQPGEYEEFSISNGGASPPLNALSAIATAAGAALTAEAG